MRALEGGQEFIITRNGVPVGELRPLRRRFVGRAEVFAALSAAPAIERGRFRRDLDRILDQTIEPRG